MDGFVTRSYNSNLSVTGDGRTVIGKLAPYGEVVEVNDGFGPYLETIDPGAFDRLKRSRAKPTWLRVHLEHEGEWVGRGDEWLDDDTGLVAAMRLDDTEAGRKAAFKVRDGQTAGLSLSFMPGPSKTMRHKDGREIVHRSRIKLIHHVALVPDPAYAGAQVTALRAQSVTPEAAQERLEYWKDWTQRVRRV